MTSAGASWLPRVDRLGEDRREVPRQGTARETPERFAAHLGADGQPVVLPGVVHALDGGLDRLLVSRFGAYTGPELLHQLEREVVASRDAQHRAPTHQVLVDLPRRTAIEGG